MKKLLFIAIVLCIVSCEKNMNFAQYEIITQDALYEAHSAYLNAEVKIVNNGYELEQTIYYHIWNDAGYDYRSDKNYIIGLEPNTTYSYYAYLGSKNDINVELLKGETKTFTTPTKTKGTLAGHEWVDLGLSVRWATCNIDAISPEYWGSFFAWGETKEKYSFTKENYRVSLLDPIWNEELGTLPPQLDAATVLWGSGWRMPTQKELIELYNTPDLCSIYYMEQDPYYGYKIVAINGEQIFLPSTGYYKNNSLIYNSNDAYYWSANNYYTEAYCLDIYNYSHSSLKNSGSCYPHEVYKGLQIRPVCDKE